MKPTEHEATVAVDAAARVVYEHQTRGIAAAPPYDALDPMQALHLRESVLPLVWAGLEALPDRGDGVRRALISLLDVFEADLGPSIDSDDTVDLLARLRRLGDHGWAVDVAAELDRLDPNVDPERAHSLADDLLLTAVPTEVRAAYERLHKRAPWWAGA